MDGGIPPPDQLVLNGYVIDPEYRAVVYARWPLYTVKEIVNTYLGLNPQFPSQAAWRHTGSTLHYTHWL